MRLNTKVRYGLRAIKEIAEASEPVLQKEISEKQLIPLKYLDSIISGLRIHGLIRNFKGKKSGYLLTKPAAQISVYDVYLAFEPELAIVDCLCEPNTCELTVNCDLRFFWESANQQLKQVLMGTTLQDILDRKSSL